MTLSPLVSDGLRRAVALIPPSLMRGAARPMWRPLALSRPSLLSLMAAAASVAAVANAVALAEPAPAEEAAPTRLGTSIQQSMRERDQAFADRKRALDLREQAQRAAELRLQKDLQANADPADRAANGDQADGYEELARIYQTMKPAKAAPIFERLEIDVQTKVARRMRERSTALILGSMSPQAAVNLSMALAGRHVEKVAPAQPTPQPSATPTKKAKAGRNGKGKSAGKK